MNLNGEQQPSGITDDGRTSSKDTESPEAGKRKPDQENDTGEGTRIRKEKSALSKRKKPERIRKSLDGASQQSSSYYDRAIDFLRKNCKAEDLSDFKESLINESGGFSGLRSNILVATDAISKRIFNNFSDPETTKLLFVLGVSRKHLTEMLDRVHYYEEMLAQKVKSEL